jgi:hypothetical protein
MNTDTSSWIFKSSAGDAYQRDDGTFFLRRADGSTKDLTKFEIQRFLRSISDQQLVDDALKEFECFLETQLGIKMPDDVRGAVVEKAKQAARAKGIISSTSVVTKIFE